MHTLYRLASLVGALVAAYLVVLAPTSAMPDLVALLALAFVVGSLALYGAARTEREGVSRA